MTTAFLRVARRGLASAASPSAPAGTCTLSADSPLLQGRTLAFKYLGARVPYQRALAIQHATVAALQDQGADGGPRVPNVVYLVQHPSVYTAGRRIRGTEATEGERLRALGAEYYETQRGGETTYHGPGQLVGYPILHLKNLDISVRCYVSLLEKGLIRTCRDHFDLDAGTCEHTGVWVGENKIAALGVHVSRYVTLHGFALNVNPDLRFFNHIVPCGITDRGVTSVARELASRGVDPATIPTAEAAIPRVLTGLADSWGVKWTRLEESHPEWNAEVEAMLVREN
ncbi:hypothetical protein H9P43_006489 [Blastocladiella emersonii ATCC 22665]|nr:hypothetical protein H9P43_006489 [Blastocladiella emersonii ATCC 22665]